MERREPDGEIEPRLERWKVFDSRELCDGCLFLKNRVFFAGEGPTPPLHLYCRCHRSEVPMEGIGGVALLRLVLEARANGRAARFLWEEAQRRSREDWRRRVDVALIARHPEYARMLRGEGAG